MSIQKLDRAVLELLLSALITD